MWAWWQSSPLKTSTTLSVSSRSAFFVFPLLVSSAHALFWSQACAELLGYKSCSSLSTRTEEALVCLYIFIQHVIVWLSSLLLACCWQELIDRSMLVECDKMAKCCRRLHLKMARHLDRTSWTFQRTRPARYACANCACFAVGKLQRCQCQT